MGQLLKIALLTLVFLCAALLIRKFGSQDLFVFFLSFWIFVQVLYMVVDRFIQHNHLLKMKKEALHAELTLLKSQINPHFFFNTLNNLYAMARSKSDQTPHMIYKLSEMMRFTIYEGKKDHVPIADEVTYLEHYLDIQALRTQSKNVVVSFKKYIENDLQMVPPLLFIMLVENAFKHGVASLSDKAYVTLTLHADSQQIRFEIENNYGDNRKKGQGIGLENLKRRLMLLFPKKHVYVATKMDGVYKAKVEIYL